MITVACVCWGDKFPEEYVYNLKSMVERNTTFEHNFVVFSDREWDGIDTRILKPGYDGWWNKLQMFDTSHKLGTDRIVYLDLDTVITGNLDWLMSYSGRFMGIEDVGAVNAHQPYLKGKLQSAIMAWDYYLGHSIWTDFLANKPMNQFRGDGEYLEAAINPMNRDLLQNVYPNKLKSYKYDVYNEGLKRNTSIVCFHGRPSIIQAMNETIETPMGTYEPQSWIEGYWRG